MEGASFDERGASVEPGGRSHLLFAAPLLLAGLALLVWAIPLLGSVGFAYDDKEAIVSNPVVNGALPPGEAFARDYWHHLEDAGH